MTTKLYEKIKSFIINNYKFLIVYLLLVISLLIKFDYEIYTPGSLKDLNNRIVVEDSYNSTGTFNLTYVSARPGMWPFIVLSYIIPSWDKVSLDDSRIENEDTKSIEIRNRIELENVNEIAKLIAFKQANVDYSIKEHLLYVYHVFQEAKTTLKTGDVIKEIDGIKVNTFEELKKIVKTKEENDTINLLVLRDNKNKYVEATIYKKDNQLLIGIYTIESIKVNTSKKVTFNYKNNEGGPSGGLMSTLSIYDSLVKEDITKGRTISGTGTIEIDGSVGSIGGVKYKLAGAVKKNADIFIVPSENYSEALTEKEENNYTIELIEAKTFEQVLQSLK